jgi:histone deacetylase complex regulatory component SIN3
LNIPAINDQFFDFLRDVLDTRELDRRKQSIFKPLSDTNFSSYERPSPSYVSTPVTYPTKCSGKTAEIRAITNDKWISVPYGSE